MRTRWQIKTGEALFVSGVLKAPLRGCPFLLANAGGVVHSLFSINEPIESSLNVRFFLTPPNWRGLKIAPFFGAKVIDFAWFSSLSKHRGAATSSTKVGRVSFFLQVCEQVSNNALKASHKTVLQNWSVRSLTYQHSEGEMECGSRNQGMRCQK